MNIAFDTDVGNYAHRQYVRYGMNPPQPIHSATTCATRPLVNEMDLGSIDPGKAADLVAADCDLIQHLDCQCPVHGVIKTGLPVTMN